MGERNETMTGIEYDENAEPMTYVTYDEEPDGFMRMTTPYDEAIERLLIDLVDDRATFSHDAM